MDDATRKIFVECIETMLRPILRFCMRRSIKLRDFQESAKKVLVELAAEQLKEQGEKVTVSRLSVMTGVHRPDVRRIYLEHKEPQRPVSFIYRIIGHWRHDKRFRDKAGRPKTLASGRQSEFEALVQSVSSDLNPYTCLYELERIGAVQRTKKGIRLVVPVYVQRTDMKQAAQMMATDTADLMSAIEENLAESCSIPNYHLVAEFDNIVEEAAPNIRKWLLKQGTIFQKKVSKYLAEFDRDLNPDLQDRKGGTRVVFGGFSRVVVS